MTAHKVSNINFSHHLWWQLVAFALLSTLAIHVGLDFKQYSDKFLPESKSFTSTFNKKPSGLSGLLDLTGKVGLVAHTWQLPYRQLPKMRGTLVVFQPEASFRPFEADQILSWVKEGNQLIYFDEFAFKFERRLINKLGIDAKPGKILRDSFVRPSTSHVEFSYVNGLTVTAETRLTGGRPMLSDESGALITEVKHGKGRILLGVMPSLCANRQLMSNAGWPNFQFMINLFRTAGGDFFFDEFCHGYSQSSNVFVFVAKGPAGLVLMQLLLIFLLAVSSSWQRFGSIQDLVATRKISNLEFIDGLANTYRRAKANGLVAEVLSHNFRLKLSKSLGVSSQEPLENLVGAWAKATNAKPKDQQAFLLHFAACLKDRQLSDEELVNLLVWCDKISDESKNLLATRKGVAS